MPYKIAVACETFVDMKPVFEGAGEQFDVVYHGPISETRQYIPALKDADGALISVQPLTTREVLSACPRLKVVSRMGVGVDSIDLAAATEMGVMVCNVPGVNTVEVADHTMAMLLAIIRQIPQSLEATLRGAWSDDPKAMRRFQTTVGRIAGNVVGIIGLGNIGRAVATRVRGFGPRRVVAYDPYISQSAADLFGVQLVTLRELLAESDFITVHTPLTEETRHLIDAETLAMMKPTAILLNCARGPIVDQVALHAALRDGVIAFAGIDVTEREPIDPEDPLLSLPNVFVTPHLAGYSPTFLEECGIKQAENVARALTGRRPHGLANPDVVKTIAIMRAGAGEHRWSGTAEISA